MGKTPNKVMRKEPAAQAGRPGFLGRASSEEWMGRFFSSDPRGTDDIRAALPSAESNGCVEQYFTENNACCFRVKGKASFCDQHSWGAKVYGVLRCHTLEVGLHVACPGESNYAHLSTERKGVLLSAENVSTSLPSRLTNDSTREQHTVHSDDGSVHSKQLKEEMKLAGLTLLRLKHHPQK